jgi:hypothetical protein
MTARMVMDDALALREAPLAPWERGWG